MRVIVCVGVLVVAGVIASLAVAATQTRYRDVPLRAEEIGAGFRVVDRADFSNTELLDAIPALTAEATASRIDGLALRFRPTTSGQRKTNVVSVTSWVSRYVTTAASRRFFAGRKRRYLGSLAAVLDLRTAAEDSLAGAYSAELKNGTLLTAEIVQWRQGRYQAGLVVLARRGRLSLSDVRRLARLQEHRFTTLPG